VSGNSIYSSSTDAGIYGKVSGSVVAVPGAGRKKKGKRGKSIAGILGNLASGAEQTITGLGPGLISVGKAVAHDAPFAVPRLYYMLGKGVTTGDWEYAGGSKTAGIAKPIAKSYEQKYGPAFHGDFGQTWNEIYKDPFGTLMDVAALASAGVGGAAKAGVIGRAAREIELAAPSGATVSKALAGSELSRRLRLAADSTLKKLPPDMQVLGEHSRYARVIAYKNLKRKTGLTLQAGKYQSAMGKLDQDELVATNLLHEFPTRRLLEDEKARLAAVEGAEPTLRLMNDPKILDLVDNPTDKMLSALYEAQTLTEKQAAMLTSGVVKKGGKKGNVPALTEESALRRRYQPALVARGAKYDEELGLVAPEGKSISGMIEQINKEVAEEGRHQPIYHPQQMGKDSRGVGVGTGGRAPQRNPVHENKAILQTLGKVAYDIEALTPSYMRTVKWAIYTDRHADLMRASVKVEKGMVAPEGYIYVKRNLSEKIPHTEQMTPEFEARLAEYFPEEGVAAEADLLTPVAAEAVTDVQGFRYMVPKPMADKIAGEYVKSSTAAGKFFGKPVTVWRSLVLNLRIGWLTNNVVGNTLMYAIRNAGPQGLKAYLQSLDEVTIGKLLRDKEVRSHLTADDIVELLPEHAAGTFMGTQLPGAGTSKLARAGRAAAKYTTQPLRKVDIAYEQTLRRAMVNKLVRQSPEFKKVWTGLPKQTRNFRAEARKLLEDNPKLTERISKEVNDALGDFLQMSDFEQRYMRNLAPFYAWYKEITKITLRLPLEVPIRTDILTKLGQAGWDENVKKLGPDGIEKYLRSLYIIGDPSGGHAKGLSTSGLNPFMTVPQETVALSSLLRGDQNSRNQLLGMMNPFIAGFARWGGSTDKDLGGLLTAVPKEIGAKLPQTRLYRGVRGQTNGPYRTYENTPLSEILAYLGVPIKNVNLDNARANYAKYHGK
jgi:hypothetical protein